MKKIIDSIQFESPIQAVICVVMALFAVICFVGIFYNPFHILFFIGSVSVCRVCYTNW
jgi:hypothetical protein